MINIAEVWIANGTGILLMVFFLLTRKWNKDNNSGYSMEWFGLPYGLCKENAMA